MIRRVLRRHHQQAGSLQVRGVEDPRPRGIAVDHRQPAFLERLDHLAVLLHHDVGNALSLEGLGDGLTHASVAHQHGVVAQRVLVDRLRQLGQGPGGALEQRDQAPMLPQPPFQRAERAEDQGLAVIDTAPRTRLGRAGHPRRLGG